MNQNKFKIILSVLFLLPGLTIGQLNFQGIVKDLNTGTELEGALVILKPLRISGGGYYTGKITEQDGTFKTTTTYDYPLQIVVTKKGCVKKIVKVKKDENITSYIIEMDCEKETIDQIILENKADSDEDGVFDIVDKCPEITGAEENEGCPWPDSDQDGVLDKDDDCPEVAGLAEKGGCPLTDKDEDGVDDEKDNCPDEAGSIKNIGCPDQPISIIEIIKDSQILFSVNSLSPIDNSDLFLSNLSVLLKKYSYINLVVTGYASSEGTEQYNQALSERRSANIKSALEDLGVKSSRIKSFGQGENNPVFANDSEANRAKNRSVRISLE